MEQEAIFQSNIQLDSDSRTYLREAAKWAKFLGVMGFIGTGLMFLIWLLLLITSSQSSPLMDNGFYQFASFGYGIVIFFYIIIVVLGFLISMVTFRFGQRTYNALISDSQLDFQKGMSNLRFIFRIYGIFMILYLLFIGFTFTMGFLRNLI